jgi:hypothetical protein
MQAPARTPPRLGAPITLSAEASHNLSHHLSHLRVIQIHQDTWDHPHFVLQAVREVQATETPSGVYIDVWVMQAPGDVQGCNTVRYDANMKRCETHIQLPDVPQQVPMLICRVCQNRSCLNCGVFMNYGIDTELRRAGPPHMYANPTHMYAKGMQEDAPTLVLNPA